MESSFQKLERIFNEMGEFLLKRFAEEFPGEKIDMNELARALHASFSNYDIPHQQVVDDLKEATSVIEKEVN